MSTLAPIDEHSDDTPYIVLSVIPIEGTEEEVLQRAASVNYLGDFSIAHVLVGEAKSRGIAPLPASKFESIPGKGAKALIAGMEVRVGSPKFLIEERIAVPVSFAERISTFAREGKTVIVVLSGRSLSGAIILAKTRQQRISKKQETPSGEAHYEGQSSLRIPIPLGLGFALGCILVVLLVLWMV